DDARTREVGHRHSSYEAGEQSERAHCGGIYRGKRSGVGGAKGGGQGECAPAKHALDSEPGSRVTGAGAYTASNCRHTPEVGAVCGKAARTVLCGGRAMKRASLPLQRREFITLLGGAAVAWPLAARAQQPERMRRIGVLMNLAADDVEGQQRLAAFLQGLQEAGWQVGRNVRIDIRSTGDIELNSKYAMELLALAPDVFLAAGAPTVRALQKATRTVPIVFTSSADPVGAGLVASLGRPSGNATGFSSFEYSIGGKWLEFLKQIAPTVTRVAVVRDPDVPAGIGQFGAIQA